MSSVQKAYETPLHLVLMGMFMGFTASLPGVSPAAIPFLFSSYEDLIGSFNFDFFRLLVQGKFKFALKKLQIRLFLPVAAGAIFSIAVSYHIVSFFLESALPRVYLYSSFLGITLAAARVIQKKILAWKAPQFFFLTAGLIFSMFSLFGFSGASLLSHSSGFFSGLVAICSYLLPGFSFPSSSHFSALLGALIGWLFFSRLFSVLLKNYRERTLSFFLGSLLGSIPLIWPFGPHIHSHFVAPLESFSLRNMELIVSFLCIFSCYAFFSWFYRTRKLAKKEVFIPE
jgi:uncharacterized membrane protein